MTQADHAQQDEHFMAAALAEAQRGLGHTSPNPPVGCVLVRGGKVIGRGYHAAAGELHAEAAALRDAGDARGATCYVTLEPCSHIGRQPACTSALVEAGVGEVVYGCRDADPRSRGRAEPVLQQAGIAVRSGVLEAECARLLDWYTHCRSTPAAFMHLKLALSLDGKLATRTGSSQWLSGPESLGYAHYLRQKYDAVMVGAGTVLADDPRLNVRAESLEPYCGSPAPFVLRDPVRIVFDPQFELLGQLRTLRLSARGSQRNDLPATVWAGLAERLPDAESEGVLLLGLERVPGTDRASFADLASRLPAYGIHGVLVEGGAAVAAELIRQRAADKLTCVYTPHLIGADGMGFIPALGLDQLQEGPQLDDVYIETLGRDCAVSGRLRWPSDRAQ